MQELPSKPSYEGIGSHIEEFFFAPLRRLRQWLFAPLTQQLVRLGIHADWLSYASVVPGIAFCLLAPWNVALACWLLLASLVIDGLDGVLARQTQTDSVAGAFTDMCCDMVVLASCTAGLAWAGLIHPALAIFFVFLHTTLGLFFLLHHLLRVSTRWLVRPGKTFLGLVIVLYCFFHFNLLNVLLAVYLLTLPALLLSFRRLKQALSSLGKTAETGKAPERKENLK